MLKQLLMLSLLVFLASGEAQATPMVYEAVLKGPSEVPPNASPGIGFATITYDDTLNTLQVDVTFSGLIGTTTASHIHCCTSVPDSGNAGVATQLPSFIGFPASVTAGTYDHTYDLTLASSFNPAFITAHGGTTSSAEAALLSGLAGSEAYLNIHTTAFPGGEIRGFLHAVQVPEPATWSLLGIGLMLPVLRKRLCFK